MRLWPGWLTTCDPTITSSRIPLCRYTTFPQVFGSVTPRTDSTTTRQHFISVQGHEGKMVFGVMTAGDRGMPVVLLIGRAQ